VYPDSLYDTSIRYHNSFSIPAWNVLAGSSRDDGCSGIQQPGWAAIIVIVVLVFSALYFFYSSYVHMSIFNSTVFNFSVSLKLVEIKTIFQCGVMCLFAILAGDNNFHSPLPHVLSQTDSTHSNS